MDIFKRNQKKASTHQMIALILLFITILIGGYRYYDQKQLHSQPIEYTENKVDENNYFKVNLDWLSPAVAYYGDNEEHADSKLFYGLTDQEEIVLIQAPNKETYQQYEKLVDEDGFVTKPISMVGSFSSIDSDMKQIVKEAWATLYDVPIEQIDESLTFFNYQFTENGETTLGIIQLIGMLLAGMFGLIFGFLAWRGKQKIKRYLKVFSEANPEMTDFNEIDQAAQLKIERQGIIFYEPFLFSDKSPLGMVNLKEVKQVYLYETRVNHVKQTNLVFQLLNRKQETFVLKNNKNQVEEDLIPLFEYIATHYPEIIIGYK